ncbi:MAG TPA: N-acetylmuramoyl-L-alanine amidase [Verrucomicrobiae bacterium]|nr:N-acetylmuramoyl-L-alanine amidase [Verrucomicrobiae bacterium]
MVLLARGVVLLACALALPSPGIASHGSDPGGSQSHPKPAVRLDGKTAPVARPAGETVVAIEGDIRAVVSAGDLFLDVAIPKEGVTDAWLARFVPTGSARRAERAARGGTWPAPGKRLRLRYPVVDEAWRVKIVRTLFPGAAPGPAGWVHPIDAGKVPPSLQTLPRLALWYTGSERNAPALAEANPQAATVTHAGDAIAVPRALLLPAFAALLPPAAAVAGKSSSSPEKTVAAAGPSPAGSSPTEAATGDTTLASLAPVEPGHEPDASGEPPEPEDDFTEAPATPEEEEPAPPVGGEATVPAPPPARRPVAEGANELSYGRDAQGPYAVYRLKKGEALYSAVVVRFTGRVDVQEVNDLTARVAERSGIKDVTRMPVGSRVRIPLDLLLTEYLPREDPRRQEWERHQAEVERYTNPAPRTRNLEGVAVILDAGHGGRDIGASHNGVWEHDYVYDVLCRVKALLEKNTRARVIPTIRDRRDGYKVQEASRLKRNRSEVLLTDPPFPLSGTVPSVNLRWYLSNSWYRKLVREGTDPSKVVFTSFHADARHPSMAGAMVYVPGAEYRAGRYGSRREVYARYREAREVPYISFTRTERERSEGLSRQFADDLIGAFGDGGVRVHPYEPVRERIIRRGRAWVPAVLRCNAVPVEVLIEISNLSNPQDSQSLADPAYRQKVAEAYVEALGRYFDGTGSTTASRYGATNLDSTSR